MSLHPTVEYALAKVGERIAEGDWPPGDLLPSERSLAAKLNISRTPLRAALCELTRRGQLQRHRPRGYLVVDGSAAESLPLAQTIGILTHLPSSRWRPRTTADRTEDGVRGAVIEGGAHLLQFRPDAVNPATVAWMKRNQFSGVVATHGLAESPQGQDVLRRLRQAGIATVAHGNSPFLADFDRVICDQERGMYELTAWLLARGCRRILRLWGATSLEHYWLRLRNDGHLRACREAGVEPLPPLHWPIPPPLPPEVTHAEWLEYQTRLAAGYLAEPLLAPVGLDAIVCVSDGFVPAVARACQLLGKDPARGPCICGFDDYWRQDWADHGPAPVPVATVNTQPDAIGRALVALLRERLAKLLPEAPQCRLIEPQLVIPEVPHA